MLRSGWVAKKASISFSFTGSLETGGTGTFLERDSMLRNTDRYFPSNMLPVSLYFIRRCLLCDIKDSELMAEDSADSNGRNSAGSRYQALIS